MLSRSCKAKIKILPEARGVQTVLFLSLIVPDACGCFIKCPFRKLEPHDFLEYFNWKIAFFFNGTFY